MKYAYYPGCSLHTSAKEYDASARAISGELGIELQEIPDWVCCGASAAHMTSELLSIALPVRDLITSTEMGLDTAVCCAACYSRLRVANEAMKANRDEIVNKVDQVFQVSPQAVQFPDHQGISWLKGLHARMQAGPMIVSSRGLVFK